MTQTFLSRILAEKAKEVETMATEELQPLRDTYKLYDYLKSHPKQLQVIAEVKKASPSFGDINLDVAIDQQAKCYQENGAAMISVLTDPHFFKGSIEDLRRNVGATVILLIAAALPEQRLKAFYDFATQLGLEVLVETHHLAELEIAHRIGVKIIGINNRNLQTFETDVHTSLALSEHFQEKPVYISESAILTKTDAALVAPFFNGILVGRALMQAENVAEKVKELQIDKG